MKGSSMQRTLGFVAAVALLSECRSMAGDLTVDNLSVNGTLVVSTNVASAGNGVLYYPFSSDTVPVPDASGNGHTGTVSGATWTSNGVWGGAYSFDGNDQIGMCNEVYPNGIVDFTMVMWVKFASISADMRLVAMGNYTVTDQAFFLFVQGSSKKLSFGMPNRGGPFSTAVLTTNTWYMLGAVCSNKTVQLYINGATNGSPLTFSTMNYVNNSAMQKLGAFTAGELTGVMDEVRFYDASLSSGEMQELYASNALSSAAVTNAGTITAFKAVIAESIAQENPVATNVLMGKLGIGTNEPSTLLDVNGDATVRGALTVSGGINGSGTGLSSLDAANLASGTIPLARLSGITSNQLATTERDKLAAAQNATQVSEIVAGILSTNVAADSAKLGGKNASVFVADDGTDSWSNDENGGGLSSTNWSEVKAAKFSVPECGESPTLSFYRTGDDGYVDAVNRLWLRTTMAYGTNTAFSVGDSMNAWFSITGEGKLGIGTEAPEVQLHGTGSARFDGGITYQPPLGNLSMGVYTNQW